MKHSRSSQLPSACGIFYSVRPSGVYRVAKGFPLNKNFPCNYQCLIIALLLHLMVLPRFAGQARMKEMLKLKSNAIIDLFILSRPRSFIYLLAPRTSNSVSRAENVAETRFPYRPASLSRENKEAAIRERGANEKLQKLTNVRTGSWRRRERERGGERVREGL